MLTLICIISTILFIYTFKRALKNEIGMGLREGILIMIFVAIVFWGGIFDTVYWCYTMTDPDTEITIYEQKNDLLLKELNKYKIEEIQSNDTLRHLHNEYYANLESIEYYNGLKDNMDRYKFLVYFGGE